METPANHPDMSPERARNLRERPATPPVWQSYYHVIYTLLFCIGGIALAMHYVSNVHAIELLIVPFAFVAANFVEYFVHRWPMHHKYPGMEVMLKLHMVHHNYFYQDTYRIAGFADYAMIVFPPIVLNMLALGLTPVLAAATWWIFGMNAALLFVATVLGYYLLMQLIHVLCHVDPSNPVLNFPGLRFLWTHHMIHHDKRLMTRFNFNFIVPIADYAFGTATQDAHVPPRPRKSLAV